MLQTTESMPTLNASLRNKVVTALERNNAMIKVQSTDLMQPFEQNGSNKTKSNAAMRSVKKRAWDLQAHLA